MNETLLADQSRTVAGLGTLTFTAPSTIDYSVIVGSTLNPPTGLSIVINQNGSPVVSQPISAPSAMSAGASAIISCTAGDVITIVLSSSVNNDTIANNVKTTVSISTLSY